MGGFTAKLELPAFVPKREILGKQVFDRELVCIGAVKDWDIFPDGLIKIVVKTDKRKNPILVPFSHIKIVGDLIMLKTRRNEYGETVEEVQEGELKSSDEIDPKKGELKSFDEIDIGKIDRLVNKAELKDFETDQKKIDHLVKEKKGKNRKIAKRTKG